MDTTTFVKQIEGLPGYRGQVVHVERLKARRARYARLNDPLPPALQAALERAGAGRLYSHQARAIDAGHAILEPVRVNYYTQPREINDLRILRQVARKQVGSALAVLGEVRVTQQVIGFRRVQQFREETLGVEDLDLPAQTFDTVALWWDVPQGIASRVARRGRDLAGGLHAVEHAAIGLLPLFAMCDRWDIGGLSTPHHADTGAAQVFIYDAFPGGVGIAEKGFDLLAELWQATYEAVRDCPCEDGCPSCIQVSTNNGQTGSMARMVENRSESQEPSEFDRFVYPDRLQEPCAGWSALAQGSIH